MKIAFVGTGMIGSGLAVNAAMHGCETALYYRRNLEALQERIKNAFNTFVEAGACTAEQADAWFGAMEFSMDMEEVLKDAVMVQESIKEDIEMKKDMYRRIQEIRGDSIIIASSTSAMFPSKLSEGALFPEKIIVGHPYNPSYLLPLIEICGPHAPKEVIDKAKELYTAMGKVPVVCMKENPGFVVNSLSWAVMDGAMAAVKNGVCTVEDIDKALMYGPGARMAITGQILTISLGIQGGLRAMGKKYGAGQPEDSEKAAMMEMAARGVDEEIANRPEEKGNTVEGVEKFRDKALVELLKIQKVL